MKSLTRIEQSSEGDKEFLFSTLEGTTMQSIVAHRKVRGQGDVGKRNRKIAVDEEKVEMEGKVHETKRGGGGSSRGIRGRNRKRKKGKWKKKNSIEITFRVADRDQM